MKKHATLASAILYLASLFLPAYGGLLGHMCLTACVRKVILFDSSDLGFGLYFPAFPLTTLVFLVALYRAQEKQTQSSSPVTCLTAIGLLHLVSWFIINLILPDPLRLADANAVDGIAFAPSSQMDGISRIGIGYYLWLAAYLIVLYSLVRKQKSKKQARQAPSIKSR